MLCFSLFFIAVVSSTLLPPGAIRPSADCSEPKKFPKGNADAFVKKINHRRRLMIDGEQKNGLTGRNLPTGESVAEMEWSCNLEEKAMAALKEEFEKVRDNNTCPVRAPEAPNGTTGFWKCIGWWVVYKCPAFLKRWDDGDDAVKGGKAPLLC
ncbi:hypothetical protein ANCCAN_00677 [Ancylostoma caninum]|uniref:SCP domain-containing protein n=1 Tax=Ancylostoma caninum TaxID=29170 RepID=A0A368H969_ANCCA|nr:hypothetical protein ANCCAN_00677 [Ancylostoma caninum]